MSHDKSQAVNVHVTHAEEILNKQSGWKAITGTTDFGEIVKNMRAHAHKVENGEASEDEGKWALAFNLFVDRVVEFVGAYYLKLEGKVDAVVFSGGIGEKSVELREVIIAKAACLGFTLDHGMNAAVEQQDAKVVEIGNDTTKRVLVCRTDEQFEMARECSLDNSFWKQE
jgi:acetate kinase